MRRVWASFFCASLAVGIPASAQTPPPATPASPTAVDSASPSGGGASPSAEPTPTPTSTPLRVLLHAYPPPLKPGRQILSPSPLATVDPSASPALAPTPSPAPTEVEPALIETTAVSPTPQAPLPSHPPTPSGRLRKRGAVGPTATPVATPSPQPVATASPQPTPTIPPFVSPPTLVPTVAPRSYLPVPSPTPADAAYDLVGGTWLCRTFANTPISHRFVRAEDAVSLVVESTVELGGRTASLLERYRFHPSTALWTVSLADGQFLANAVPWRGSTWTFTGTDSEGGRVTDALMIYKRTDVDSFTRTFLRIESDGKTSRSGERCRRTEQSRKDSLNTGE